MCKMKDYSGLYLKAKEAVRLTGINPEMAGYEMLVKAIVIYKVDGPERLYEKVAEQCSVIPYQKPLGENAQKRHPVEQLIVEAVKSVGIEFEELMLFIDDLARYSS